MLVEVVIRRLIDEGRSLLMGMKMWELIVKFCKHYSEERNLLVGGG